MSQRELLQKRGINAVAACDAKINRAKQLLTDRCGDVILCPTMFYDTNLGQFRKIRSTDHIKPCENYKCAIDQMLSKNDKFRRWITTGKWPGSVSGSLDAEVRDATEGDLLEMAEQVEKFCEREVSQTVNFIISQIPERSIFSRYITKFKKVFTGGDDSEVNYVYTAILIIAVLLLIMLVIYLMSDTPMPIMERLSSIFS